MRWCGNVGVGGVFGCSNYDNGCEFKYVPHEPVSYPVLAMEMAGASAFRVSQARLQARCDHWATL